MLEALTFDFWGTLYKGAYGVEPRIALLGDALSRHGQRRSRQAMLEAYDYAWSRVDRVWKDERRSMPVNDWLEQVLSFLDVDLPERTRAGLRRPIEEVLLQDGEGPVLLPRVGEVVPRLARRYRMGLISDIGLTPGRVLREFLRRDGLLPLFEVLTFSDEAGATKPDRSVFLRTLSALGSRPESAAHIGDLPETDITGARGVGMRAVLFLGASKRDDGLALADAAFEDYSELETLLAAFDDLPA